MFRFPKAIRLWCLVALLESVYLVWLGPLGVDIWAHTYYLSLLERGRLDLWNFRWYSGSYVFVGYGILPYLLALVLTLKGVEFLSIALTVIAALEVGRRLQHRVGWAGPVLVAVTFPLTTMSGALPYLCAVALCSLAFVAVLARRRVVFAGCVIAGVLCSALAIAFFGLILLALLISECAVVDDVGKLRRFIADMAHASLRFYVLVVLAALALFGLVDRAFPTGGRYPFFVSDLLMIIVISGLVVASLFVAPLSLDPTLRRALLAGSVLYAASSLVLFFIPSPVGANLSRLSEFGLPLLGLLMVGVTRKGSQATRRRSIRPAAIFCLLALVVVVVPWSFTSVDGPLFNPSAARTGRASYWSGATAYLASHLQSGQRVELVDPASHSGDYFLAHAGISLVRGWFRQDDFPLNETLYSPTLSAVQYLHFLRTRAVSFVVLPGGPYDFSSQREAAIVSQHPSGLRLVWRRGSVEVFAVRQTDPLISGGTVLVLHQSTLTVRLVGRTTHLIRINYSPYLVPSQGCLERVGPGLMRWVGAAGGDRTISFNLSFERILTESVVPASRTCS